MSACGANRTAALRVSRSGIHGLPQSRPFENDQSRVAMRPLAPAARARSNRCTIASRLPLQYTWKKVFAFAATTSSTGFDAYELNPMIVPRFAAARATATSPSGCTACTPVGEMMTGSEMGMPITVVSSLRCGSWPATCGANCSSANAFMLSR